MKAMYEFLCEDCDTGAERYNSSDVRVIPCDCGGSMRRQISLPTILLEGISGDFPSAHDKWARIREDRHRKAKRDN